MLRISRATAYKEARRYQVTRGQEGLPVIVIGGLLRVPRVLLEAMIGGPIHRIPARAARTADTGDVVDLRDHRSPKPKRTRRTKAGTASELPIDIV